MININNFLSQSSLNFFTLQKIKSCCNASCITRSIIKNMDFKIVDKNLDSRFREILRRIRRLQSGGTIDSLKEIGANTDNQIGASYVSLKQLAAQYEPEESLALLLWNTGKREEQIVACMLLPLQMNREKITQLMPDCLNAEIAGYVGSLYLFRHPDLSAIANEWLESGQPFQQVAILTALARHLIVYKNDSRISREYFHSIVHRDYEDVYVQRTAERYRFNN